MNITDWIQAFSSIIALAISTFAVIQTYKIQKDNSRPYINVYVESVDTVTASKYISIKNFGKSPAFVTDLKFSKKLDKLNKDTNMQSMIGTTLAPNQKVMSVVDNKYNEKLTATIHYTDKRKHLYSETFPLNFNLESFLWTPENFPDYREKRGESPEARAIRIAAHALLKKIQ